MTSRWRTAGVLAAALLVGALSSCGDPEPVAVGTVTQTLGEDQRTVKIHVVEDGDGVSGSIDVDGGATWSIHVQCRADLEGTLVLGGEVTGSAGGPPDGSHAAAIVKQGTPDRMVLWMEDPPPADTCGAFVARIPAGVVTDLPPVGGDITTRS
jgi:hypothetical protein